MGGFLSKVSSDGQTTSRAQQPVKEVVEEEQAVKETVESADNKNDESNVTSKDAEEGTEAIRVEPPAFDESTFETVQASQLEVAAESKDIDIISSQPETVSNSEDKLSPCDTVSHSATDEGETTIRMTSDESSEQPQQPEMTVTEENHENLQEVERKMEELNLLSVDPAEPAVRLEGNEATVADVATELPEDNNVKPSDMHEQIIADSEPQQNTDMEISSIQD